MVDRGPSERATSLFRLEPNQNRMSLFSFFRFPEQGS